MQVHHRDPFCKSTRLDLAVVNAHLEDLPVNNNLPEDLSHIHIKQAASPPLKGDGLTPLTDVGLHDPEGLGLKGSNLLVPLHAEVEGGGLAGAI